MNTPPFPSDLMAAHATSTQVNNPNLRRARLRRAGRGLNLMVEQYRGFQIYGRALPVTDFLLGRAPQWYPSGSIDYVRPRGSLVELTRFQLPGTTFEEKEIAEWFGLEIARLAVDSWYRDFAIARYETEKQLVMRDRLRR